MFNSYYNISFFQKKNLYSCNFFLGSSSIIRNDSTAILNNILIFTNYFHIAIKNINILSRHLGRIACFELNLCFSIKNIKHKNNLNYFNFFIGLDTIYLNFKKQKNINVYVGSFFLLNFFEYLNLVLSASIYVENTFSYLNLEGRFRYTNKVITAAKSIFVDYNIVNSLHILQKSYFIKNFSIIKNYTKVLTLFNYNYSNLNYNIYDLNKFIKSYNLTDKLINNLNYSLYYHNLKLSNTLLSKTIYNFYNPDIY